MVRPLFDLNPTQAEESLQALQPPLRPDACLSVNSPLTCWTSPSQVAEERFLAERGYRIIRATPYPRHLLDRAQM